jgi:hypothetical protein
MTPAAANERFNSAVFWSACALLFGIIAFGMIKPSLTLGRFIPLDPNEGWNAYFGEAAIDGSRLYPPRDSLITNNYPPLSFYVVGGIGYLTGDNIFAGRVIALLSLLFVAWSIYYWLRISGSARRIGLLGAVSFMAYAVTYGRDYVAMNDPQWLAHAIMMSGLIAFWKSKDDGRHFILAAVLVMAAGWTKHLLLPLPAAASVWLLWRSRPLFAKWVGYLAASLAVACALAWWFYGPRLFESLHEPREYVRQQAVRHATAALECFAPLLTLWLIGLIRGPLSDRMGFVSIYVVISAGLAVFASGGAGVDVNPFFDLMIGASLAAAMAVELLWLGRTGRNPAHSARGPAAAMALAVCVVAYAVSLAPRQIEQIRKIDTDEQAALQDIEVIHRQSDGHAACEIPGLCYWAKSAFTIDFFYLGQKLKTGVLPPSTCATTFQSGTIPLVQLDPNPKFRAKLLPPACNDLISAEYRPIRESSFGPLMVLAHRN